MNLNATLDAIQKPDAARLVPLIQERLDDLTKPQGSLGRLEDLVRQVCLAQGTVSPRIEKKRICCFAADHGVTQEGVSAYPKAVTPQMVRNMLNGGAAINVLARQIGAELVVVDMGVDDPLEGAVGLRRHAIRRGTDNLALGPAMKREEAEDALTIGIALADEAAGEGISLLGTGEMGIGNTTSATALLTAYLHGSPRALTGRGTGIDHERLAHKVAVIQRALAVNRERLADPVDCLAALGGFEIAAIAGLALGGAAHRIPVVVDGFISTAGAVAACAICPAARAFLIFSHLSQEQGHRAVLEALDARPVLDLDMRLGEGTGAAIAMGIVESAIRLYLEMATFSGAGVSRRESEP